MKDKLSKFFDSWEADKISVAHEFIEHEVVKGDNPWKLSVKYFGNPSAVNEIMEINNISDPTKIQIGTILKIPKSLGSVSAPSTPVKPPALTKEKNIDLDSSFEKRDLKNLAEKIADQVGVPSDLFMGLIQVESNWNPEAKSGAGAAGLTQLMPGTAQEVGVRNPFNPAENLLGGAKYLKKMLQTFSGEQDQEKLALMAYHAGAGNVRSWIKAGRPPTGHKGVGKYTLAYPVKVFSAAGR